MSAVSYYFSLSGFKVDVLTTNLRYARNIDHSILHGASNIFSTNIFLPPVVRKSSSIIQRIYNRLSTMTASLLFNIDPWQGWVMPGLLKGYHLILRNHYDAIIVSGPPFSSFTVAAKLAARSNVPLILDYRDAWTAYKWNSPPSEVCRKIEAKIVGMAAGAVFSTKTLKHSFQEFFPSANFPLKTITNGFHSYCKIPPKTDKEILRFAHAGTLYGERTLKTLIPSLKAISKLEFSWELHHYGYIRDTELDFFEKAGLRRNLHLHDRIPHDRLLYELSTYDVLIALSGSDVQYAIPYKIFDYISTRVPILGITPTFSELHEFINSNKIGIAVSPDNNSAITDFLINSFQYETMENKKFSWRNISYDYLNFIQHVIGK